jgi:hypothetical protein
VAEAVKFRRVEGTRAGRIVSMSTEFGTDERVEVSGPGYRGTIPAKEVEAGHVVDQTIRIVGTDGEKVTVTITSTVDGQSADDVEEYETYLDAMESIETFAQNVMLICVGFLTVNDEGELVPRTA